MNNSKLQCGSKRPNHLQMLFYNPLTPLIKTFRYGFLRNAIFSWGAIGYTTAVTLGILLVGIVVFNKVEKNFVDTV